MVTRLETDPLHQQLTLRDGRRLGFAEYGPSSGATVFYFHGWPGSRLEPRAAECVQKQLGIHIIGTDRPGYGLSTFQERRRILDWVSDVSELADALGLERFAVLGVSGGGPYAAACAARIPDRLSSIGLVCSVGPLESRDATRDMVGMNRRLLFLARRVPWLARALTRCSLRCFWNYKQEVLPNAVLAHLPESDRQLLASGQLRGALLANWSEAFRAGTRGMVWDGCLYARQWGFSLAEIRVPVHLWHGAADVIVPASMGRDCAGRISNCRCHFLPQEGHFSLPLNHLQDILGSLAAA
jgi:pimeloyl-ACP methyl ester carboxylesterase